MPSVHLHSRDRSTIHQPPSRRSMSPLSVSVSPATPFIQMSRSAGTSRYLLPRRTYFRFPSIIVWGRYSDRSPGVVPKLLLIDSRRGTPARRTLESRPIIAPDLAVPRREAGPLGSLPRGDGILRRLLE